MCAVAKFEMGLSLQPERILPMLQVSVLQMVLQQAEALSSGRSVLIPGSGGGNG